jgi:hypothetical protein
MAADLVDHIVTRIGTIVVVCWVWRLGNRTDNHHTRLAVYEASDAKREVKIQQLSDQAIRQDVLTQVTLELGGINRKLDSVIDQSADAKVTRAIVEQMQRQILQHP